MRKIAGVVEKDFAERIKAGKKKAPKKKAAAANPAAQ